MDIEEIVRSGGNIVKFVKGFMFDNLEINLFERCNMNMTEKINKFKKENRTLLHTLTEKKIEFSIWWMYKEGFWRML